MKDSKHLKLFLVRMGLLVTVLSNPLHAFCQWGSHSRYEIGDNFVMATGKYEGKVSVLDASGNHIKDSSVSRSIHANFGIGGMYAMTFPLKRLGKQSVLSLSMQLIANAYLWGDLNAYYDVSGSLVDATIPTNGFTVKYGLPVGLDVKVGTDALCRRKPHFGYTFGAGVIPQYNISVLDGGGINDFSFATGNTFAVTPYIKAEASFYLLFCFKVRAMFSFVNIPLIDASKSNFYMGEGQPFKLTETSNLCLSVSVLPFSYRWKKLYWYNDYDPVALPFR